MTVAMVAVTLATQLVVPLVLGVLSLFFARLALRNAAAAVRRGGRVAVGEMRSTLRWVTEEPMEAEHGTPADPGASSAPRLRLEDEPAHRARAGEEVVLNESGDDESVDEAETAERRR
jgi:hypothetical protein